METLRVALIGKTGAGKSALGNTLLGERKFKSTAASESVTIQCEVQTGKLANGRFIKVVDTPGVFDTEGRDVRDEVTKAIAALSPGPHAFLIVLTPGRATVEERRAIQLLQGLFGDESFLEHAVLVMNKKADMQDENEEPVSIEQYMQYYAADDVKELFGRCGNRIVAVENKHASSREKQIYAQDVVDEIVKMGGFYSHAYFKLIQEKRIQEEEIKRLRQEIERIAAAQKRSFCSIL